MHESVFVEQIINEASKKGNVISIVVEVGDLAHVPKEDIEKALKDRVKWNIKVKSKKAIVKCDCGYIGRPKIIERTHDFLMFSCPECESIPGVLEGDKIILKEVICA